MATSRQFTYGGESAATSGTTKSGRLWVGTPTSPERNDLNYSGKIWWMGPDEDDRYIIGKDVPTSDWPSKGDTPPYPHDSGSVRFWASEETNQAFITRVNGLPARQGEPPFSDISDAYNWISGSGYWTNYEFTSDPNFASIFTYDSPLDTVSQALGVMYSSTRDKLFINTDNRNSNRTDYGNFVINDFSTTVTSNSEIYFSGSNYTNQWLETNNAFAGGGLIITTGYMALSDADDLLFVRGINKGSYAGKGVLKYDISTTPPTLIKSGSSSGVTVGDTTKIAYESTSDKVITTNGGDDGQKGFVFDGTSLDFEDNLLNASGNVITDCRWAVAGPAGKILMTRESINNYRIYDLDAVSNPYRSIFSGTFPSPFNANAERDSPDPIYVASKNKWYVPFKSQTNSPSGTNTIYNYAAVINGSTYAVDTTFQFGAQSITGTQTIKQPRWFLYDSVRDYFWTTSPKDSSIVAIDADTGTQIGIYDISGDVVGQWQSAVIADDKLVLLRKGDNNLPKNNAIKIFDLGDF